MTPTGAKTMTLLNRKTDYALLILWFLNQHAQGGSAREIAARFGLSRSFVANILKELCQRGFVASHRGVNGGYALQRPVAAINLAELMQALEEPMRVATCTGDHAPGDGCTLTEVCPVRGPIAAVHHRIHEVLRTVTLAELFRPAPADPALIPSEMIAAALAAAH
jgi:Rrf2 family transcriptional regulator, cysteine metabolism repressor